MSTAVSLSTPTGLRARLAERRREVLLRQELNEALAGQHGPGVRAEVLAAMQR